MNFSRKFLCCVGLAASLLSTTLVDSEAHDEVYRISASRKASTIIIPSIEFRSTTLADGIEFLRQESVRLDYDPDVTLRGVNIYLKLPAPVPTPLPASSTLPDGPFCFPVPSTASSRLTLTLKNVPLLEVLRYIAVQFGLKVVVDEYAIGLVTPETNTNLVIATQELKEAEFSVSPETGSVLMALLPVAKGDPSTAAGLDPMPWLKREGVSSPMGASAVYLPSTRHLVVRNTSKNLDRIKALFRLKDGL